MAYVRFSSDLSHTETCGFEEFSVSLELMGACGAPAIGYTGRGIDSRVHLCRSHFEYTRLLAGVYVRDVVDE